MIDRRAVAPATAARPNAMTVDLDAVAHNVRELKNQAGDGVTFVAALKANAYGFGLNAIANTVLAAGADMLAVASVDDAIALRGSGIGAPIMLYGGTRPDPQVIAEVGAHDIIVTVLDEADVVAYGSAGTTVRAMVKVDVGLERLGVEPGSAAALVRRLVSQPGLELAGLYTHLHVPGGTMTDISAYVDWQYRRFVDFLTELDRDGIDVPLRIAASSGSIRLSEGMTLNGVDVGSLLFGLEPPGPTDRDLGLRQALVGVTSRLTQARPRLRTEFVDQSPIPTRRPMILGVIPF